MDADQQQNQPRNRNSCSGRTDRVADIDLSVALVDTEEYDDIETGTSICIFRRTTSQTKSVEEEASGFQVVPQRQNIMQPRELKYNVSEETQDVDMLKSQNQINISELRSAGHGCEDERLHIKKRNGRGYGRSNNVLKVQVCDIIFILSCFGSYESDIIYCFHMMS